MIALIPYSPDWVTLFEDERDKLFDLEIHNLETIEHIGSTAISGIHAKPVIDILIGIRNISVFSDNDIHKIESLGYRYNQKFEAVFPDRRYFQKDDINKIRTHQIHLVQYRSSWFEQPILFRNYLRTHDNIAREYEQLKFYLTIRLIMQMEKMIFVLKFLS